MAKKKATGTESSADTLIDDLKRLQADYENYRKRVERDRELHRQHATEALLTELLPILESLELVLAHGTAHPETLAEGVTLTRNQLLNVLESHGLHEIPTDIPFDPRMHEAVRTTDGAPANTITETHQHGYMLGEKVLRPAKVTITKGTNHAT